MIRKQNIIRSIFSIGLCCAMTGCNLQPVSETVAPATDISEMATASTTAAETTALTTETTEKETQPVAEVLTTALTTCTTAIADESIIDTLLSQMTLEEKICQMFIVTPEQLTGFNGNVTETGSLSKESFDAYPVGGLIYFSDNLEDTPQTYSMLSEMQTYAQESTGIGVFLSVDEEGGTVARVADNLGTTKLHDMEYYGELADEKQAYAIGSTIGSDLKQFGFNLDFAPVADVNLNANNELGSRIFSSDADVVGTMVANVVAGLKETGVASTLKHFPGLGAGDGNTHYDDFVFIDRTLSELESEEFVAFQAGIDAGADFVMVGHQITAAAGDQLPSDLSSTVVTTWLKGKLGFTGIVITDAQNMAAITENYSPATAAAQAVSAGVDMILMPMDLSNAVMGISDAIAAGTLTEERINESVRKILIQKQEMGLLGEEYLSTVTAETTTGTGTTTTTTVVLN
jgi:beta-N-acetylhexosaminidase